MSLIQLIPSGADQQYALLNLLIYLRMCVCMCVCDANDIAFPSAAKHTAVSLAVIINIRLKRLSTVARMGHWKRLS